MIVRYIGFLWLPCFIFGFVIQSYVFTIFSTCAFMACFQCFRNLQVNSFMMLLPNIAT